jgi:hypothetical protein
MLSLEEETSPKDEAPAVLSDASHGCQAAQLLAVRVEHLLEIGLHCSLAQRERLAHAAEASDERLQMGCDLQEGVGDGR